MAVFEAVALKALTGFATAIAKKFADKGWNKLESEVTGAFTEAKLKAFCSTCKDYVNMRTLYSSDKDIYIDDIYVPLYVSPSDDTNTKIEILNVNFHSEGVICINGVAGQGKTTFMRKMLLNTIQSAEQIPIFLELKYFEDKPIVEQIKNWFSRHEINISSRVLANLLKSGTIKVLLDGFDEIKPNQQDEAARRIKELSKAFPKLTIIVSSRPYTVITKEPSITNYKILDFEEEDIERLFLKISDSDIDRTEEALQQLNKYPKIKRVVNTPILAILLFMTYRYWSKVPDNLADFYKRIFVTLLTHHDSIKPGKKIDRGIDVELNDYDIEDVFSVFCFLSFVEKNISFSSREAMQLMEKALVKKQFDPALSKQLLEIVKNNTGILCSDGYDQISFTHKSLQEFYTAYFISQEDDSHRVSFYKKMQDHEAEIENYEILTFLSGLDRKFYAKHYYIPIFKKLFEVPRVYADISKMNLESGIRKICQSFDYYIDFNEPDKPRLIDCVCSVISGLSRLHFLRFFPVVRLAFETGVFSKNIDLFNNSKPAEIEKYHGEVREACFLTLIESLEDQEKNKFLKDIEYLYFEIICGEHEELISSVEGANENFLEQIFNTPSESKDVVIQ